MTYYADSCLIPFKQLRAVLLYLLLMAGSSDLCYGGAGASPTGLVISVTVKNPSCNNRIQPTSNSHLGDGSILAIATGGTSPYTYSLKLQTGPQNNGYFPGLGQGNYDVEVVDALGATASQSVYLANSLPQPLMGTNILQVPSDCTAADGSLELMPFGGTPPYTFSTDGGLSYHTGGNTLTGLQQGAYYQFFLKDANGCIAVSGTSGVVSGAHDMFICNFCCLLQIQSYTAKYACDNTGQFSVYASNATKPVFFSLDGINYQAANNANEYEHTFYNLLPGNYHVYAKDATGSITQGSYTLPKACADTINYLSAEAGCGKNNGSVTLSADFGTAPYSYTLDGVSYQTSNTFTGLAAGNYNTGAVDALGASSSSLAVVKENCPVLSLVSSVQHCGKTDGSITAQGVQGLAPYAFSIDGLHYQADNVFTGLAAGSYTIRLQDANGSVVQVPVTVYSDNCLQVNTVIVNTSCGRANGSITVQGANGTMPYTYSKDGINFESSNVFSGLLAGSYVVTVKDAAGLTSTSHTNVYDQPAPAIQLSTVPASCQNEGGSITMGANGGLPPFQYSVNGGPVGRTVRYSASWIRVCTSHL